MLGIVFPGFHRDAINDHLWGDGYTEWWRVRNATSLFPGHIQPHVPLHGHHYDLSQRRELAKLAKRAHLAGIDSLLMYEYWFGGERFLRGPLDTLLKSPSIKTSFALCYADIALIRKHIGGAATAKLGQVLVPRTHNETDDAAHARWLGHNVFSDPRYLRIDGKPVYALFRSDWRRTAAARQTRHEAVHVPTLRRELRRCCNESIYVIEYVAAHAIAHYAKLSREWKLDADAILAWATPFQLMQPAMKRGLPSGAAFHAHGTDVANYEDYASIYIEELFWMMAPEVLNNYDVVPCVLPGWDNTPRHPHGGGTVLANSTPGRFGALMRAALRTHCARRHGLRATPGFVSINALNEWGEGCYMEPDEEHQGEYYRALHEALQ